MCTDTREILEAYCATRDTQLRNVLVERHLYLAGAVAKRFAGRGADVEDLTQVASLALIHALERFDCQMGLAFSTFAMPTLTGEVRNYLRDKAWTIRRPRAYAELLPRLEKEREAFCKFYGREPSVAELAGKLDLPLDTVLGALEMRRATQSQSLDAPLSEEDGMELEALLGCEEEAYTRFEGEDFVSWLLTQLEGANRFIIEQRFLLRRSQREVAKDLGISQMQVSRLERRTLEMLRGKLR